MSRSVRSFLNVDTPALAKIWHLHHQAYRSKSDCTVVGWDHGVLAKPFFSNDDLIVAEDPQEGLVGFIHVGCNLESRSIGVGRGILHRLCVRPGPDEDLIADELIRAGLEKLACAGLNEFVGVGAFHDSVFYIGIAEGDGFLGVHANDLRLVGWMRRHGFRPLHATECWELSLANFKLPMDRTQIGVHRNSLVSRILGGEHHSWWQSVVFGHCDLASYQLVTKTKPTLELRVDIWTPEAFVPGTESWIARLIIPELGSAGVAENVLIEHWICLLAECLRLLHAERKQCVQVVIDPASDPHVQILERLGFKLKHSGVILLRDAKADESNGFIDEASYLQS